MRGADVRKGKEEGGQWNADKGGGGSKKQAFFADVLCAQSLTCIIILTLECSLFFIPYYQNRITSPCLLLVGHIGLCL